jgi:AraC-like DNA-binding protein
MLGGMRAVGVDVDAVCAAAGFSEASLAGRKEPVPLAETVPLWQLAKKQFGRGTLGVHVGTAIPSGTLLDYLGAASPDLRAALGQVARYIGLLSRNVRWVLGQCEADGLFTFEQQVTFAPETIPPQLNEFGVAICVARIKDWFGVAPREVWFQHSAQGPADEYRQLLGCEVRFARERMGLRFDDAALATPAQKPDAQLFRLLESHAARVLAEAPASASLRDRVRRAVVERLRAGEPSIAAIAEALATSERSLQRKLQAEGVSFRDVVDEARHKLALLYLGDRALSLADVAYLLGYSENAAFTRAFKRWTGRAPSQARR